MAQQVFEFWKTVIVPLEEGHFSERQYDSQKLVQGYGSSRDILARYKEIGLAEKPPDYVLAIMRGVKPDKLPPVSRISIIKEKVG